MLSLLLDLKPLKSLSDDTIETLLFEGVNSPPRGLAVLLQRGAPIDFRNSLGETILMDALYATDFDLATWLFQQGASVNIENKNGVTPANILQDFLSRVQAGTETQQKLLRLKSLMEAQGIVFPVPTPKENRAKRGIKD